MAYYAGDQIDDVVVAADGGVPLTGAPATVFSSMLVYDPDNATSAPTVSEVGGGVYAVSFPTNRDKPGRWAVVLVAAAGGQRFVGSYDVDPRPGGVGPSGVSFGVGTSRAELRRWVGRLLGNLVVCTATDDGAADGTTLVDAFNLAVENNSLLGRQAYVADASATGNAGLQRRVAGNTKTARSLTLDPPLPQPLVAGDVVELHNERGLGPAVDEIHATINNYIQSVRDVSLDEQVTTGALFDWRAPAVALPSGWQFFSGADWEDALGLWHPVPPADLRVDVPNRTVEVRNRSALVADRRPLRLRGHSAAGQLTADTDTTGVDAEWLAYQTAAQLLIGMAHRAHDPSEVERRAQYFQTLADQRRPKARSRFPGKAVRLG